MRSLALIAAALIAAPASAADPLGSPNWDGMERLLDGGPVRFDPRVRVIVPMIAENQRSFPVVVDARGIAGVRRILILADLNPIPLAVDYRPLKAAAYLSTNIKLDQRTPVRGAVQLADGSWLVGGVWVDAAGGGCSMPSLSRGRGDWAQHLGEVRGGAWSVGEEARLRLAFRHPMDTGFVANIPTYNLESVEVKAADGSLLASFEVQASVAEDPQFGLIVQAAAGEALTIAGRDTNGVDYDARLTVAGASGAAR
ncbi:quinoprotein dehydrogenase-associated SoxYZ-like carrier [Sphingomonas crocodyli]|uniref:Quinoprotein dehydrogenase-associated SoxYZ-like carrier n=1 Tax=Sphingomonas crocodyli TaxID=1979270 RepID=A0A437M5L9_9SPHN|nr:quinoprotein dehydrogenase-associated SoxYZ-like carrier [Sphingomonas crocodyli]RVT93030.1 quinoprotein dehydrogenase-associated SoxYZ-like carrier [Sphingomonas crocodyli]